MTQEQIEQKALALRRDLISNNKPTLDALIAMGKWAAKKAADETEQAAAGIICEVCELRKEQDGCPFRQTRNCKIMQKLKERRR